MLLHSRHLPLLTSEFDMSLTSWSRTTAPAGVFLVRLAGEHRLYFGRHPEVYFSRSAGFWPLRQDRNSLSSPSAPLVGAVEIVFGGLILLGLFTRLATIPLLAVITVAIWTTKLPLMHQGIWAAAHESRTDWSMLLCLLFLLIVGAGSISVDNNLRG